MADYASNDDIKAWFFRGKTFPSDETVDSDTNTAWKAMVENELNNAIANTGSNITDTYGLFKKFYRKLYKQLLDGKDFGLSKREKWEIRDRHGTAPVYTHVPDEYETNISGD